MQIIKTPFEGLIEIIPNVYHDSRGWFKESFKDEAFEQAGIASHFKQENISFSKKGVIRGLHFQLPPYGQAKLVSVASGKVLDVVVDIRKGSPTFGKVFTCELSAEKHNMLFVPDGFAHGLAALEDSIFTYKITSLYHPASESGIIWNDPTLKIKWPFAEPIISDKDRKLPTLDELLRKSVISQD